MQPLPAALEYAARGWRVFPLPQGRKKDPYLRWSQVASADPTKVLEAWTIYPNANIGIATGEDSNLTVLDLDTKDGKPGLATAKQLLGDNWRKRYHHVVTPSGGVHVYFPYAPELGNRNPSGKGLEIQGNGAYVVAPPSMLTGVDTGDVPGWYDGEPVVNSWQPEVLAAGIALLGERFHALPHLQSMPTWADAEVSTKRISELQALIKHQDPVLARWWLEDEYDRYTSRSEPIFHLASWFARQGLTPAQVMWLTWQHSGAFTVAMDRRGSYGAESMAAWLWDQNVAKATGQERAERETLPSPPAMLETQRSQGTPNAVDDPGAAQPKAPELTSTAATTTGGQPHLAETALEPADAGTPAAAGVLTFSELLLLADHLSPAAYDQHDILLGKLLEAKLLPAREDIILAHMHTSTGVTKSALTKQLSLLRTRVAEANREGLADRARPLQERYVYVMEGDQVWDLTTRRRYTPTSFANMYGPETRTALIEGQGMARCHHVTYWPQNPWRPGFDREQVRWVRDERAGGEAALNVWQPPGTHPMLSATDKDIKPWWDVLDSLGLEDAERVHLVQYLAFLVQNPHLKINHALVLGGAPGCGKDWLLAPLAQALGAGNILEAQQHVLDSDFDTDLTAAKVLRISELGRTHDKERAARQANKLKPYCAAPPDVLGLTLKGRSTIYVPNLVSVIATTNYKTSLHLDPGDRRWFLAWTDADNWRHRMADSRRSKLWSWMEEPQPELGGYSGAQAVAGRWLNMDTTGFRPNDPPSTEWKEDMQELQRSDVAHELDRFLETATLPDEVPTEDLREVFVSHLVATGSPISKVNNRMLREALDQLGLKVKRVRMGGRTKDRRARVVKLT